MFSFGRSFAVIVEQAKDHVHALLVGETPGDVHARMGIELALGIVFPCGDAEVFHHSPLFFPLDFLWLNTASQHRPRLGFIVQHADRSRVSLSEGSLVMAFVDTFMVW